MYLVI